MQIPYNLIPVGGLIIVVIGSIYAGFATPTEAAAVGGIQPVRTAEFYRPRHILRRTRGDTLLLSAVGRRRTDHDLPAARAVSTGSRVQLSQGRRNH